MRKQNDPLREAAAVQAWNASHAVGAEVDYRFHRDARPKRTTTMTQAQMLGGHTAIVWIKGVSGCVAISHCTPV